MKILILTGAGLSAESGLPTIRDKGGLWQGHPVEEVATPDAFHRNPGMVLDFYNARRDAVAAAQPNAAHYALARLPACEAHKVVLITQNVDDLLERGGAGKVFHLHGSLFRARCNACGQSWPASYAMEPEDICLHSEEMAVRPDVVWFGEAPQQLKLVDRALEKAHIFVAIGTPDSAHPAAGLVGRTRELGCQTLELNAEPAVNAAEFDESRCGPPTELVPDWVAGLVG